MNYWKFIESELPEWQEGWPEGQEGLLEGQEGLLEGQEGLPEGQEAVNFEDKFCNVWEEYGVELDRDRNLTPISKLVPATVNDLKWDCFTGQWLTKICVKN